MWEAKKIALLARWQDMNCRNYAGGGAYNSAVIDEGIHARTDVRGPISPHAADVRVPMWLKIAWTVWLLIWAPVYGRQYGAQNFLFFCDIGNVLIGVGLWLESALFFSWVACGVLLFQSLYIVDLAGALVAHGHVIGGTEYMFAHPDESAALGAKELRTSVPYARRALEDTVKMKVMEADLSLPNASVSRVFDNVKAAKLVPPDATLDRAKFIDESYLRESSR